MTNIRPPRDPCRHYSLEVGAVSVAAFLIGNPAFYMPNEKSRHLDLFWVKRNVQKYANLSRVDFLDSTDDEAEAFSTFKPTGEDSSSYVDYIYRGPNSAYTSTCPKLVYLLVVALPEVRFPSPLAILNSILTVNTPQNSVDQAATMTVISMAYGSLLSMAVSQRSTIEATRPITSWQIPRTSKRISPRHSWVSLFLRNG